VILAKYWGIRTVSDFSNKVTVINISVTLFSIFIIQISIKCDRGLLFRGLPDVTAPTAAVNVVYSSDLLSSDKFQHLAEEEEETIAKVKFASILCVMAKSTLINRGIFHMI
jgi:hypothetical protein